MSQPPVYQTNDQTFALGFLCGAYLRPTAGLDTSTSPPTPLFDPPLTPAEQATLADLQTMADFGITADLSLAEFQALKPYLATGKAYLGLSSPTNAQTVAALKAVIRVVGALLRS